MNHLFIKTYYSLLLFIVFKTVSSIFNKTHGLETEYVMLARPLNLFDTSLWVHYMVFFLTFFFCLICIFKPHRYLRVCTSILVLMLFSIIYSYGKIGHSYHIWMISSILMCSLYSDRPLLSRFNCFVIRLNQTVLLSHYFISGLWKIRLLISTKFEFSLKDIILEYIAYGFAESEEPHNLLLKSLVHQYPWILALGFAGVIVFQITSVLPVFLNRFFTFYGILALLFHLSTGIMLSIYFHPTVLGILFFLFFTEMMIKNQISGKTHCSVATHEISP